MKVLRAILFLAITGLVVLLILQKREIDRLASAKNEVEARLAAIEEKPVIADAAQEEELARLRKDHRELLQLRGEVNVLKRQLQQASAPKTKPVTESPAIPTGKIPPVKKYEMIAQLTLQQGESAVIGGWETTPGKRTVVLATPEIIHATGDADPDGEQISVCAHFIELPEALFSSQFVPTADGSLKQTFGDADTRRLLQQFRELEGVDCLTAPKITTLNGRQAQVSVLDLQIIGGEKVELGSSLDIIPTIAADGSIQVTMIPNINLRNQEAGQ